MRALTTTAIIPTTSRLPVEQPKAKRIRFRLWPKRREPSLFARCLAVHIAKTTALK